MDTINVNSHHNTNVKALTINGGALCIVDDTAGMVGLVPKFVGQMYYDTDTADLYVATGVTADTDWKIAWTA